MTKKPASKSAVPAAAEAEIANAEGLEADYKRFLPHAQKINAEDVKEFHLNPHVASHNLAPGVAAVLAEKAQIKTDLPRVDLTELEELPALASAVVYAASLVDRHSDGVASQLLNEARALSKVLGAAAVPLAHAGIFSPKEMAKVAPQVGASKLSGQLTALAALFAAHKGEIAGKTTVTAKDIENAAKLGKQLESTIKPKGSKKAPAATLAAATDIRNRLGTLLISSHEQLWSVGAYLFGFAVEDKVPFLGSHAARVKPRKPKDPPATGTKAPAKGS